MRRLNFVMKSVWFLVFFLLLSSTCPGIAKHTKFQSSLIVRDCRVYEELYEGIECRNASFEDIPICEDGEEVVTSPRRTKLCCCIRVKEDDVLVEGEKEGDKSGGKGGDCRDVGCINPGSTNSKGTTCSGDKVPLLFDGGTVTCCCAKDSTSTCQVIGCSSTGGGKGAENPLCTTGFSIATITHEIASGSSKQDCCCPTGEGQVNFGNLTCSHFLGCETQTNSTEKICSSDFSNATVSIDTGNDGSVEDSKSCCCKSVSKSDIKKR